MTKELIACWENAANAVNAANADMGNPLKERVTITLGHMTEARFQISDEDLEYLNFQLPYSEAKWLVKALQEEVTKQAPSDERLNGLLASLGKVLQEKVIPAATALHAKDLTTATGEQQHAETQPVV